MMMDIFRKFILYKQNGKYFIGEYINTLTWATREYIYIGDYIIHVLQP